MDAQSPGAREEHSQEEEISVANSGFSRRQVIQAIGATALSASIPSAVAPNLLAEAAEPSSAPGLPKIALEISRSASYFATGVLDDVGVRRLKQLGVNDVLT